MKSEERKTVIICAAVIVVSAVYFFVYKPLVDGLVQARLNQKNLEAALIKDRSKISSVMAADIKKSAASENDIPFIIEELIGQGKIEGIDFISIIPEPMEEAGTFCRILPLEIEVESAYESLGVFLGSFVSLKRSIITLKKFYVCPDKNDSVRLYAKLTLNVYIEGAKSAQ